VEKRLTDTAMVTLGVAWNWRLAGLWCILFPVPDDNGQSVKEKARQLLAE